MSLYTRFPCIAEHPIFQGAPPEAVTAYLKEDALSLQEFSPHQEIYSSQTGRLLIGFLCSGNAHVLAGHGGGFTLLNALKAGDMFGVANLFDEESPFPTRILSVSHTRVLFVEGDAFRQCVEQEPCVLRNYLSFQSRKIMYLNRKILTYTAGSAEKKLILFLLEQRNENRVILSSSMVELAEALGIGRASLYRAVDALIRDGLLCREGRGFLLPDPDGLERRYESASV